MLRRVRITREGPLGPERKRQCGLVVYSVVLGIEWFVVQIPAGANVSTCTQVGVKIRSRKG